MKRIALFTALVFISALLSSCASSPDAIKSTYVSPSRYENWTCRQITEEIRRVESRLGETSAAQKKKATSDAVGVGIGIVLFWPALFLLAAGEDQKQELARLKGEYDALMEIRAKKCGGILVEDKKI
jgi:hypothetical protein